MLYFLAAGTLVLLISAAFRVALKRANPRVRYSTSLASFAVLALLPVGIATQLLIEQAIRERERPELTTNLTNSTNQIASRGRERPEIEIAKNLLTTENTAGKKSSFILPAEIASISVESFLNVAVGYLPWVWVIGTPLTFLLLTSGLVGAERLRRSCAFLSDGPIHDSCEQLRIALGIGRQVGIAICERVATPLLVGVVRPLILLPPAALNGWATEELEMVLLHELAHVRRWDNAVNLTQRIVESLLFFHPAVWIMSTWVRRDREDCCDAVVVGHTAKPQAYAELLLALASHQSLPDLAVSAAMAQHPLASRIRRILKLEDEPMRVSRQALTVGVTVVLAVLLVAFALPTSDAEEAVSREAERVSDERSAEKVTTNPTNRTNKKLTTEDTESTEKKSTLFPTLEDQRAADIAYKLLGVELEKLSAKELERVKATGYAGGLRVASGESGGFLFGDLLVGLHVWPTEALDQVNEILCRDDLDQLSPLKFYVIRRGSERKNRGGGGFAGGPPSGDDQVATGRVQVELDAWRQIREQQRISSGLPYLLKAGDDVLIVAHDESQTDRNKVIDDAYSIDKDGSVNFGPLYGKVFIAGKSLEDARYLIEIELRTKVPKCVVQLNLFEGERPINSIRSNTAAATPLYDGKTFDQWRELWKTELKTEKRIECIDAFVAFGRAGRGQEAAEAILEVAGEYDFGKAEGTSTTKLKQAIVEVLTEYEGIEGQYWLLLYMKRLDADPEKWSPFAEWVLAGVQGKAVTPYLKQLATDTRLSAFGRGAALAGLATQPDLAKDQVAIDMVRKAIKGNDPQIVLPIVNHLDFNQLDLFPEQIEILIDRNDLLRNSALRRLTQTIHPSLGIPILDGLLAILYDPTRAADHPRAILAIGSLNAHFNNNQEMAKRLPEVLHKLNDILIVGSERLHPATLVALGRLTAREVSLVIEALGDKITDERRQQLEQAIEQAEELQAENSRGGGMGGGMGGGGGMF